MSRSSLRSTAAWVALAALAPPVTACELATSLDGLSGGGDGTLFDANPDASGATTNGNDVDGAIGRPDAASSADARDDPPIASDAGSVPDSGKVAPEPLDAAHADACEPTALVCDGLAHECNGVVDEGCPSAITIGTPGPSQLLGGSTNQETPFNDPCPTGQVLVGLGGATGQWIDAIFGVCGVVALQQSTANVPYTYTVTITVGTTLSVRGTIGSGDTIWRATCPANEAVVGVAGNSGIAMDQLVLSCAPLVVTGSPGSFALARGNVATLGAEGDTNGGSPFTPVVCPNAQMIGAISGTAGSSVDSLSVACVAPVITLVP